MKKGFLKRIISMMLVAVLCLTSALAGGCFSVSAKAEQRSVKTLASSVNGTIDAPYAENNESLVSAILEGNAVVAYEDNSKQKLTKINVKKGGGLMLTLTATESNQKFMDVSLYKDEACTQRISTEKISLGEYDSMYGLAQEIHCARVEAGTYYLKTVLKKADTLNIIGCVLPTQMPTELVLGKSAPSCYLDHKQSAYVKMQVKKDSSVDITLSAGKITLCDAQKKALTKAEKDSASYSLKAGTYYLKLTDLKGVVSVGGEAVSYAVTNNTSKGKAQEMKSGKSSSSMIPLTSKNRTRWYKINIPSDRVDKIHLKNMGSGILHYYVYRGSTGITAGTIPKYKTAVIKYTNEKKKIWKKGTYYIKIEEKNPSHDCLFKISRDSYIQNLKVVKIKNQSYKGKLLEPAVVVKDGNKKLKEGRDYSVSYRNNERVGLAKVTLTARDNYEGSKTITFKIVPKTVKIRKVTSEKKAVLLTWGKNSQADKYQVQYAYNASMKDAKKVTVKGKSTVRTTLENMKNGKTCYVRVRACKKVSGKNYYGAWSKVKKVKVND